LANVAYTVYLSEDETLNVMTDVLLATGSAPVPAVPSTTVMVTATVPHVGGPILPTGAPTVFIGCTNAVTVVAARRVASAMIGRLTENRGLSAMLRAEFRRPASINSSASGLNNTDP
jgi:hypothetical protein